MIQHRMHKSARGFGYPSDSSWTERQRTQGAQAQLAGDRLRLPSATPTFAVDLRHHHRHRARPLGRDRCHPDRDVLPGHPPTPWISGALSNCHRGPGRVPDGPVGPHSGHCRRAWIAGGSDTGGPSGIHCQSRSLVSRASGRTSLAGQRGRSGQYRGPLSSWLARLACTGPCPIPLIRRQGTHRARAHSHQSADGSRAAPTPDSEWGRAGHRGRPQLGQSPTNPRCPVIPLLNPVMRFMMHDR
jgi:hypothetical protein